MSRTLGIPALLPRSDADAQVKDVWCSNLPADKRRVIEAATRDAHDARAACNMALAYATLYAMPAYPPPPG